MLESMEHNPPNSASDSARQRTREKLRARLMNKAVHYLGRYASSEAKLTEVLLRFAKRKAKLDLETQADQELLAAAISETVTRCRDFGYVNDQSFAEMKVRRARSQGKSRQMIRQMLRQAGLDPTQIDTVLATEAEQGDRGEDGQPDAEFKAALRAAQKKRIGPFRTKTPLEEEARAQEQKEMARLARAGFGFEIVQGVFALTPQEAQSALD